MTGSELRLFGWRHFSRRAIHQVEIPWAIDRDKNQISFVGLGPRLVNHLARHAIVGAGAQFLPRSAAVLHDEDAADDGVCFVRRVPVRWRVIVLWAPDHELRGSCFWIHVQYCNFSRSGSQLRYEFLPLQVLKLLVDGVVETIVERRRTRLGD